MSLATRRNPRWTTGDYVRAAAALAGLSVLAAALLRPRRAAATMPPRPVTGGGGGGGTAGGGGSGGGGGGTPPQNIPDYGPAASGTGLTGTQFAQQIMSLQGTARENATQAALLAGNVPAFLRRLVPVTLPGVNGGPAVTIYVTPDFLGVGVDGDWLRMPMWPTTAERVAQAYGMRMITQKMADAIQRASRHTRMPYYASNKETTATFVAANTVGSQRLALAGASDGALVDGVKKNVLVADSRAPGKVVIYGGNHTDDGHWYQQPYSTIHAEQYGPDYSHGIRLASGTVDVAGRGPMSMTDAMNDPRIAPAISGGSYDRNSSYFA